MLVDCALATGVEHLSTYMKVYKVGDIVDIKVLYCYKLCVFVAGHCMLSNN